MTTPKTEAAKLSPEDERRVAEARAAMAELIGRVPRRLGYAAEPALVFRADEQR
jgi:hypothetical protein